MNGNRPAPIALLVRLRDEGDDRWEIYAGREPENKDERAEHGKGADVRNKKKQGGRCAKRDQDGTPVAEVAAEHAGKEHGNGIPCGSVDKKTARPCMADKELILDERHERRENGPHAEIHKPEKPEEGKKGGGFACHVTKSGHAHNVPSYRGKCNAQLRIEAGIC